MTHEKKCREALMWIELIVRMLLPRNHVQTIDCQVRIQVEHTIARMETMTGVSEAKPDE